MAGLIDDRDLGDAGLIKGESGVAAGRGAVVARDSGDFVDAVERVCGAVRDGGGIDRRPVIAGDDDLVGEAAVVDVEQREADVRNTSRMREVDRGRDGFGPDRRLRVVIDVEKQRFFNRSESARVRRIVHRSVDDAIRAPGQRDADRTSADGVALAESSVGPVHRVPIELREHVIPRIFRRLTEDGAGLHVANVSFQGPVAAERRVTGVIDRAGDVGTGQVREHLFGGQADESFREVAAVDQDVRSHGEVLADLLQSARVFAAHRVEIQHRCTKLQLSALSVRDDVNCGHVVSL